MVVNKDRDLIQAIWFVMGLMVMIIICILCTSCTISLNMVGSQGKAQDMVDTEQTNDTDFSIPVSAI